MAKLFILGLGVDAVHHATVEVLQAMGECGRVVVCGAGAAQMKFLERFCAKGALVAADEAAAEKLVAKELAAGKTVGLATPGHPFYWSALAGRVVAAAQAKDVAWHTFGSISPMGVAISAAGITLGTDVFGLQSFDAASLYGKKAVINPEWPVIVHFYAALKKAEFDKAVERLESFFGAGHPAMWCFPHEKPATVAQLRGEFAKLGPTAVLYLPAKTPPASKIGWGTESLGKVPKGMTVPAWVKD